MCGELVTVGGRRGQAGRPGGGREAQVPLSRLHLLPGTRRTRAGWGSADSATPVPGASALSSHLRGQGLWAGGCL